MEGRSTKPPQLTQMFQKIALSFKAKAFEFFGDDIDDLSTAVPASADLEPETFAIIDCHEKSIAEQSVLVVKPDTPSLEPPCRRGSSESQFNHTLITSLFATLSSFEASYLQLQSAHVPYDGEAIRVSDKALVSHLQTLSEFKQLYKNYYQNPNFSVEFSTGSCLEFQINENQGRLRALKSVFNRLQSEIDVMDEEVSRLKKKLEELRDLNSKLSSILSHHCFQNHEVLLTVNVFGGILRDACQLVLRFTSYVIDLMKRSGWDLDLVARSVYSDVDYVKKRHNQYAFFSYICLRMFQGFDSENFGFSCEGTGIYKNEVGSDGKRFSTLRQLIDHISNNPMDVLRMNPNCEFSRFCEVKYRDIIHPAVESSIFNGFDEKGAVINSWKSLSDFYALFVKMASSIWTLHQLAFSSNPLAKIFQVERGAEFSIVYMVDVTGRIKFPSKAKPKVGFTVVPGFRIGHTVIQSQVYLTGIKCTE